MTSLKFLDTRLFRKSLQNNEINFDAIIHAVAHQSFNMIDHNKLKKDIAVIYDVKGVLPRNIIDASL